MIDHPTDRKTVEALAADILRADIYLGASHIASSVGVNAAATLRALLDKLEAAEAEIARLRAAQGAEWTDRQCASFAAAYDREDAAQIGEPSPWDAGADEEWTAGRISCVRQGLRAIKGETE